MAQAKQAQLLARVFQEQFEVVPGASEAQPKTKEQLSSERVQNPHDPDATYASKGRGEQCKEHVGYKVQVAETVTEAVLQPGEPTPNFIVGMVTHAARESDEEGAAKMEEFWQKAPFGLYVTLLGWQRAVIMRTTHPLSFGASFGLRSSGFGLFLWLILSITDAQAQTEPSQPARLANPGFEEGAKGWRLPANATVVTNPAFAGNRSACLTVRQPGRDQVYITQQVPVEGGAYYMARCKVRTAGVERKAPTSQDVGAGLIIEWADKQGKWYAAGAYATGLYGDNDWTTRQARSVRAPEQAGYAILYLALRSTGTAWFDEVELVHLEEVLTAQAPAPGQSLRENRPLLKWQEDVRAMSYTVELSRDPAFPKADTLRLETEQSSIRPPRPLESGRWHWRVSAPGYAPTTPCPFEQTAPVTEDTTPPEIDARPLRVTRPGQAVRVPIRAGDADARPPVVTASLGAQAAPVDLEAVSPGSLTAVVSPQWQLGVNRLTLTATDAAGNAETQELLVLMRPAPTHPVTISADGAYLDAGKRIFPLGIYQVSPAAMPAVKKAGIDVVHSYEFENSRDDAKARAYLDAAAEAGLRVFIGFDRGRESKKGLMQGNTGHVVERVAALCAHPGLFCWYLFDEPESSHQYISPRGLSAYAELLRHLDPYHAVVVTTWGPRMALYRPSFDTHWTQAYYTPPKVADTIDEHRALLGPKTPITFIAHCFDDAAGEAKRPGNPVEPARFQPDAAWMRASAFVGVTHRVNGLWWWWYADGIRTTTTVSSVPEAWQALSKVFTQLHALEPVLADPANPETGSLSVEGGKVYWWRKSVGNETTLLAVNTSERQVSVTLPAAGDGPTQVLFEQRQAQRQGGTLTDSFARYDVHAYRYAE